MPPADANTIGLRREHILATKVLSCLSVTITARYIRFHFALPHDEFRAIFDLALSTDIVRDAVFLKPSLLRFLY